MDKNQCRVCLKLVKPRKLQPIHTEIYADRIFLISGVQIEDEYREYLPDKICFKCSDALLYATQIRSLCIESEKLLKKQLLDLNLIKAKDDVNKSESKEDAQEPIAEEENDQDNVKSEFSSSGDEGKDDFEDNFIAPIPHLPSYQQNQNRSGAKHEVCHICGKEYTRSYIATHLRTHQGEEKAKNFSCDLCGLKFVLKSYAYSHMINIHSKSKKFVCNICGKSYAKKNTYVGHLRNHSEEGRIFKCTYESCGKRFAQQNKLNVHMRIHSGERPYSCVHCGRGFIHYTDHKRHVFSHTGERPYRCSHSNCLRGFIKKSELTAHERTHQR